MAGSFRGSEGTQLHQERMKQPGLKLGKNWREEEVDVWENDDDDDDDDFRGI